MHEADLDYSWYLITYSLSALCDMVIRCSIGLCIEMFFFYMYRVCG